jgi:hypothetical protein
MGNGIGRARKEGKGFVAIKHDIRYAAYDIQ